jgi:hypothetical protein
MKSDFLIFDTTGPDMTKASGFIHRVTYEAPDSINDPLSTEGFLINEIGSVHLSFTHLEGAVLFVLWSGAHANVPINQYPVPGTIPDLPESGSFNYQSYNK